MGVRRMRAAARSFALTRRGTGFLVAALITFGLAPILSAPALLYATGLLLGLVLLAGTFVATGHSRVRIERSISSQVIDPGQSVRACLIVTNMSSVPCPEARWTDYLPYVVAGEASGVLPALGPANAPDAVVSTSYTVSASTRGAHAIGPVGIRVVDPFGLVERTRDVGETHQLTVLPRRYDLPPIRPSGSDEDGATRPAPHQVGIGEDDIIARSYLPGDALKRLHWKATARRGELMVRQEEQQMNPRAAVTIDLDAWAHGTDRDTSGAWEYSPTFEWAVAAAASVITHLVRAGFIVSVGSPDGSLGAELTEGHDSVRDVMLALAHCEPATSDLWRLPTERAIFVIAGRLELDRAHRWVKELSGAAAVHAMIAATTRASTLTVLGAAGWHVVTYTPQSDIPVMWSDLDRARTRAAG
ncbi:MAG: DUF58 domain-containing protein [Aeromicrobium sp.]|uniref:DUF58 domain-containing protein n=1 Tax=Aeromicrobium sp. TaxID=1871063 RepID=UPI003C37C14B